MSGTYDGDVRKDAILKELRMKHTILSLLTPVVLALASCKAQEAVVAAPEKAHMCAACHGETGNTETPIYPKLAGQNKAYLEMTLKAYRDQSRKGVQAEAMYGVAAPLTDADIKQLSAYFSEQSR